MAFHTADYDAYVALGDPNAPPLWSWRVWKGFPPIIDPLMKATRGKPALRSTQYLPNQSGLVKFGRLGWKEADHQKWSHGSPTNKEESKSWSFLSLEVWAPTWNTCERENRAPDVFLSIANESLGGGYRQELLFNPVVVFAVVSELAQREPSHVAPVISSIGKLASAKLVAYRRRPWGTAFGSVGFTNSIQDLAVSGLFKPGQRHNGTVGCHLLAEEWQPLSSEGAAS
jgi:hypothetical protein